MINTICSYVAGEELEGNIDQLVKEYAGKNIAQIMRDFVVKSDLIKFDEDFRKAILAERFPFKLDTCKTGLGCCGNCPEICHKRCVFDLLNRAFMMYTEALHNPDTTINKNIIATIEDPNITYDSLRYMIEDIINPRKNKEIKRMVVEYGTNPYKLDYGPVTIFNYLSPTRRVREYDKDTGVVAYLHWPESGLCPFAIPKITHKRNRGRRPVNDPDRN